VDSTAREACEGQEAAAAETPALAASVAELDEGFAPTLVSFVIPVLDEAGTVDELHRRIRAQMGELGLPYEIIFIDDGSRDGTLRRLRALAAADPAVRVLEFRRNFGKSAALDAGFGVATGDVVFTLDADLQDDPAEIPRFLETLAQGYDLVSGWKRKRHDPVTKTLPSRFFNSVTRAASGLSLHDFNCGFKAYRVEVIREIDVYGELHRYIPMLAHGRGFRVAEIAIQHHPRTSGRSKFGIERFARGFYDLLTATLLTRYSRRPLHLMGSVGLASLSLGFFINLYLSYLWFFRSQSIGSRPLLSLGVLLMLVGVQFFSLGLIGDLVVSQVHQARPYYSIRRTHNLAPEQAEGLRHHAAQLEGRGPRS